MTDNSSTFRSPSANADNWSENEPETERKARLDAWKNFKSCTDCRHWVFEGDDEKYSVRVVAVTRNGGVCQLLS